MTDPTRYIREMYVTELSGTLEVYDQKAPPSATTPYAVIRNVSKTKEPVKCTLWRCEVSLDLYAEFTEIGNTAVLDALTDTILTTFTVPPYKTIPNFSHARAELIGDEQDIVDQEEYKQYRKALRIAHWVQE